MGPFAKNATSRLPAEPATSGFLDDVALPTSFVAQCLTANLDDFYCDPDVIAPLGSSDHNIVKWTSGTNGYVRSDSESTAKKRVSARQSRS